jgi:DNA polymerase III delta prime subunit
METEQTMARLLAEIRTGQEHMKEMLDTNQVKADTSLKEMLPRMDANQERMNACLREEIISGEAEMKSTVNAFQEKMDAWIANMRDN